MAALRAARLLPLFLSLLAGTPAQAQAPAAGVDPAVLARIRDAALGDDWAYQRLADLADKIGPRLSGSPQAEAAVTQVAAALKQAGLQVSLQPVKVPHWVRGAEQAELVDYPGRPEGLSQTLRLTTLGGSVATPEAGITAPVLVVRDFAGLQARAAEARGRIVVFDHPFNQFQADNGQTFTAYGQGVEYRTRGASAAARLGALAMLVRSVGGADYRLPHTGALRYDDDAPKIPAAALSAEDAMLVDRLAQQGPVTLHLLLRPQTLPDADSHNVIADLPGREKPDEVVVVSGHLDSWDLAQGAIDDGAGVCSAMGVGHLLAALHLPARRSIRVIAWMNEENGTRGSKAYFAANQNQLATQVAAIESDTGAGQPLGWMAHVTPDALAALKPVMEALAPLGATALDRHDGSVGADIEPLEKAGVPGFEPLLDARTYFNYHHTAADTLDKADPLNIRRQVALMAVMAWYLAEMPQPLPRLPPQKDGS